MFHFVANLKPYTLPDATPDQRFDAYLLSADYARGLADLAAIVRSEQRRLIADNGNMDVLRTAGKQFAPAAEGLDNDRRAWERARGRYARPKELPDQLRAGFAALAHTILLPLLALLAHGQPYFATDSTAPIVDGWSSPTISLYVAEPAPLKYKAYRIADAWIRGGRGWDCECPYCARFHDAHPPDIDRARQWWRANAQPTLEKEMLERKGPLSTWLPFLSYSPDDDLRTEAALARVGHNHWILRRLELEIRERSSDWPRLLDWVGSLVDAYRAAPGPAAWKHAVTEAFAMARAAGERLLGDEAKVDEHRDLPDGHEQKGDRDGPKHEPELRLTPKSPVPSSSHDGTLPAAHSQDNGGDGDQPLVVHRVENPPDQKHDVHEPDQVDGDGPPHPADPRVASQPPPGVVPLGLFRHSGTLPGGVRNSNAIHPGAGQRKYDVPTGGDPNVHERSMTNHPPSRALLLALLQKLLQTEGISRTWQTLQPLAAEIEGLAAAMLEWVMALATETAAFVDDQFARFHAMLAERLGQMKRGLGRRKLHPVLRTP